MGCSSTWRQGCITPLGGEVKHMITTNYSTSWHKSAQLCLTFTETLFVPIPWKYFSFVRIYWMNAHGHAKCVASKTTIQVSRMFWADQRLNVLITENLTELFSGKKLSSLRNILWNWNSISFSMVVGKA